MQGFLKYQGEFLPGERIETVAFKAWQLAARNDYPVVFTFNCVDVYVWPRFGHTDAIAQFWNKMAGRYWLPEGEDKGPQPHNPLED